MKTTIITFVATLLLSFGSTFGNNDSKIYKNTITNEQNNTATTTVYEGISDTRLKPIRQYIISYDQSGNITGRTVCKWDNESRSWVNAQKYVYNCNVDGKITILGYTEWDNQTNEWKKDARYIVYSYDGADNQNLVINYIKADKILENYISLK